MRRGILGTAAAITTALAACPSALAAGPWNVVPGGGTCGGSDMDCGTITQAVGAASDGETVQISPGTYAESVAATKALTFRRMGSGVVRVVGDGTPSPPFAFSAAGTSRLQGLIVSSSQSGVPAVKVSSGPVSARTVEIDSSILSGNSTGAGIAASTQLGDGNITITADHVTVADSGTAAATTVSPVAAGTSITVTFTQSIVRGSTASAPDGSNDTSGDMGVFVNSGAEDFHLRAHTVDENQGGASAVFATDVDGDARPTGSAVEKGGDEFVNQPPSITSATAAPNTTTTGTQIQFTATASDPNPGDQPLTFAWDFGDGTFGTGASVTHTYTQPGVYSATVTPTDSYGASGSAQGVGVTVFPPPSNPVVVGPGGSPPIGPLPRLGSAASVDDQPPQVSIGVPRRGQRLRVGRLVPRLRGRVADQTGVLSVELALARRRGASCLWFDGRRSFRAGSCGRPTWFRAVVDDFAWYYAFPARVRPPNGSYLLSVRATDVKRNRTPPTASAAGAATFRIVS